MECVSNLFAGALMKLFLRQMTELAASRSLEEGNGTWHTSPQQPLHKELV